jgi:hypothetical protein
METSGAVPVRDRGIRDDGSELVTGPARLIFTAAVQAFPIILRAISEGPEHADSRVIELKNEFRKFFIWNEGFSTSDGELDRLISMSRNLRDTVLRLMLEWAMTLYQSIKFLPASSY